MAIPASQAPFPSITKTWHTESYAAINSTRPELSAKGKVVVQPALPLRAPALRQ